MMIIIVVFIAGPFGGEAPGYIQTNVRAAAVSREVPPAHRHRTGQ